MLMLFWILRCFEKKVAMKKHRAFIIRNSTIEKDLCWVRGNKIKEKRIFRIFRKLKYHSNKLFFRGIRMKSFRCLLIPIEYLMLEIPRFIIYRKKCRTKLLLKCWKRKNIKMVWPFRRNNIDVYKTWIINILMRS